MLEKLFIVGFIILPLAIAVGLIVYRARFFLIGIFVLVGFLMLVWTGLKLATVVDDARATYTGSAPAASDCVDRGAGMRTDACRP